MKTKLTYTIFAEGQEIAKTKVTVPANSSAFDVVREKLTKKFGELKFNHAGKTAKIYS